MVTRQENLTSIIMCALNQGDWVRGTVPRAMDSMGGSPHQIIVVNDMSTDGCCNGLPKGTEVLHAEKRQGVSGGRRWASEFARGDVLLFSDPHCHYPENALEHLTNRARHERSIIVPKTTSHPGKSVRFGGKLVISDRGLRVERCTKGPYEWPALVGAIYAIRRDLYDDLGGWPHLPGVWGYSEQALSLMAWITGTPVVIDETFICNHENYHPADSNGNQHFTYSVKLADQARNGAHVHAAFFPETYKKFWRPMLLDRFGRAGHFESILRKEPFKTFRDFVAKKRIAGRSERDFFEQVLKMPYPLGEAKKGEAPVEDVDVMSGKNTIANPKDLEEYILQQAPRAKGGEYRSTRPRVTRSIDWFFKSVPIDPKKSAIIDLGTRDGYVMDYLGKRYGVPIRMAYEIVPRAVDYARNRQHRFVKWGDMQNLPGEEDSYWDVAFCIHTLEHVLDPVKGVAEMCRITKNGGWLLFVVPKENSPSVKWAHNCNWPTEESFRDFLHVQPGVDTDSIKTTTKPLHRGNKEFLAVAKVQK